MVPSIVIGKLFQQLSDFYCDVLGPFHLHLRCLLLQRSQRQTYRILINDWLSPMLQRLKSLTLVAKELSIRLKHSDANERNSFLSIVVGNDSSESPYRWLLFFNHCAVFLLLFPHERQILKIIQELLFRAFCRVLEAAATTPSKEKCVHLLRPHLEGETPRSISSLMVAPLVVAVYNELFKEESDNTPFVAKFQQLCQQKTLTPPKPKKSNFETLV